MIRLQKEPFDVARELAALRQDAKDAGAVSIFIGTVRETTPSGPIHSMTLEHYPGMTEKSLREIEEEAHKRWPLEASLIVHRYGQLMPGDDIVLVITLSAHRDAAITATTFLIDWLKTKAPFWKYEDLGSDGRWVEAESKDDEAQKRWKGR